MTTKTTTTTRDTYRRAFREADKLLNHIDILMSQHSDRHEVDGMGEMPVGDIKNLAFHLEAAVLHLRRDLPA